MTKKFTIKSSGEAFELALMAAESDGGTHTSTELRKLAGQLFAKWLEESGVSRLAAPEGEVPAEWITAIWRAAGMLSRGESH